MESIYNYDDLLKMLDQLLIENSSFNWDNFYTNRDRNVPFFANYPDENLVEYFEKGLFQPGKRVLELGCGPGRNAIFFAENGCVVDAVDLSEEALEWGRQRAEKKNLTVNFCKDNIFNINKNEESYDIVYDSGCFHHIAPHRRMSYLNLVRKALKPNGLFGITCFKQGGKFGGSDISDWDVYRLRSLQGGLGFTGEKLRSIFNDFREVEVRDMKEIDISKNIFGVSGLLTGVFRKY